MVWRDDVSFEKFGRIISKWKSEPTHWLGDPPIAAQFALDLIFKTLIDDKEKLSYLTTMPENVEQVNSIMLDMILRKYSRKYRKYMRRRK